MTLRNPRWTLGTCAAAAALAFSACGADGPDVPAAGTRHASAESSTIDPPRPSGSSAAATRGVFTSLESTYDARIGVFALDTETSRTVTWRSDERFPFASTIKAPLSAAVLDRVPRRGTSRVVRFEKADLVPYSPITEQHVESGMTLREVIDAALRFSDNTAANLLYEEIGGPGGLDRALDGTGDRITDPERVEPDLNTAIPGDVRDTTTPRAITKTLGRYVVGDALPRYHRDLLRAMMINNTTGDALIRAGVPDGWIVADKTGSADYGVRNDIAVAFPPGRSPVLLAVLTTREQVDAPYDDAVIAATTRAAVRALGHQPRPRS